ncbi:MAG TPA: polyprenyl synthetase family protein [Verrucomicrobiae bacterium]
MIHDDIEDNDDCRYGERALHAEYGVAMALNIGDLLIGEGYRLISACEIPPVLKAEMLLVASECQRQLCRGQGGELYWTRNPQPLGPLQVLEIFRQKTAPAFEVALKLEVDHSARTLLETYKEEALRSLGDLSNPSLKGLLRRVIGRIFNPAEIKGWCKEIEQTIHEPQARNAQCGASRA